MSDPPTFTISAADPAAPAALDQYAVAAAQVGMDPDYVVEIRALARKFSKWRADNGTDDTIGRVKKVTP